MKRIFLSADVVTLIWCKYWNYRTASGLAHSMASDDILQYHQSLGWDLQFDSYACNMHIPELQLDFFLLSL